MNAERITDLSVKPLWRTPPIPPIRWIACKDGVWQNRRNIPEAATVIDELRNILQNNENGSNYRTVGIITFNDTQKEEIQNEIDRRKDKDSVFNELLTKADHPISNRLDDIPFVKNIETYKVMNGM